MDQKTALLEAIFSTSKLSVDSSSSRTSASMPSLKDYITLNILGGILYISSIYHRAGLGTVSYFLRSKNKWPDDCHAPCTFQLVAWQWIAYQHIPHLSRSHTVTLVWLILPRLGSGPGQSKQVPYLQPPPGWCPSSYHMIWGCLSRWLASLPYLSSSLPLSPGSRCYELDTATDCIALSLHSLKAQEGYLSYLLPYLPSSDRELETAHQVWEDNPSTGTEPGGIMEVCWSPPLLHACYNGDTKEPHIILYN